HMKILFIFRYSAEVRYTNFYTGNDIALSVNGQYLYCLNGGVVNQVDVQTSQIVHSFKVNADDRKDFDIEVDEDKIYCFALSREYLATAHESGLLRWWEISTQKLIKLWKSQHKGPVVKIEVSSCGNLICTSGGADATLRLWDFANNRCVCVLKNFEGPALVIRFHPSPMKKEIFAVGSDNAIYCWNYEEKVLLHTLRGHISQVTSWSFQCAKPDCSQLVTVGRDKMLIVWQLQTDKWCSQKVLPLYEELEGVVHIAEGTQLIVACGTGKLLQIDTNMWKIRDLLGKTEFQISRLLYCYERQKLALITTEQNMCIYNVSHRDEGAAVIELEKQLVGYNDEILDLCFLGDKDRYLAVATNSKYFKLYDTLENMNCRLISGHTDTVMSLSGCHNLLISAGKDCSIRLWKLSHKAALELLPMAHQASSHTTTIGCVALMHHGGTAFASASQDGSIKVWKIIRDKREDNLYAFSLQNAVLAHDKEVNCVTFSLNNKLLATASQDKTAKIWTADENTLLGVLRGHTRGVWCVRFSPVDQIVLTSSSDCSLRIWSVANFTCLKRLEQQCTILRVEFLDYGKLILSAASDGVLKLWDIKTNICVQSIDEHNDRVWSLAIPTYSNRFFFSGGADSKLVRFSDVTKEVQTAAINQRQMMLQQEQTLQSLLYSQEKLEEGFALALLLDKPKSSYHIICQFIGKRNTDAVRQIVDQLNIDQRLTLLQHVKAWSTNARYSLTANVVLEQLLGETLFSPTQRLYNSGNLVEVLTPYVQRHFKRITELSKDLAFMEFIVKSM
ncbi:hypothetical protein KR222_010816, partial [Zaprionus bogoriensis]